MISKIFATIATFTITLISSLGYAGIVLAMAIESACIPLPSEIIMPFSGYLVSQGRFGLWQVGLAGALGCVLGSIVAYVVGRFGGRELVWRYGKYFLVSHRDIAIADRWFSKYGQAVVFFSRLLPVIRTFISLPAGISRMPFGRFVFYTFIGSYPWCYGLAWGGKKLGDHWTLLGGYFHKFDLAIALLAVGGVVWWVVRHVNGRRDSPA